MFILKMEEVVGIYAGTYDIKGDGSGAKVNIEVDTSGTITKTTVVSGGSGYTFGIVDFGHATTDTISNPAKLIPIIPPSRGHGYNIYEELGSDKVLAYSRFDDSQISQQTQNSLKWNYKKSRKIRIYKSLHSK